MSEKTANRKGAQEMSLNSKNRIKQELCIATARKSGHEPCYGAGSILCPSCELYKAPPIKTRAVYGLGKKLKSLGESQLDHALRIVLFDLYKLRGKYDQDSRSKHAWLIERKHELEAKIAARNARGR